MAAVLTAAAIVCGVAAAPAMSRGELLFRANCIGCHSMSCNRTGPKLQGLLGRKAGTAEGYDKYTDSLKNSGIVWDDEQLDRFLADPGKLVPGTAMTILSIRDPRERKEIIGFVKRQDKSVDLCF